MRSGGQKGAAFSSLGTEAPVLLEGRRVLFAPHLLWDGFLERNFVDSCALPPHLEASSAVAVSLLRCHHHERVWCHPRNEVRPSCWLSIKRVEGVSSIIKSTQSQAKKKNISSV